ncbi:alginate export family protein [Robertkochia sediminum]|uniref:alginate export family protein n=1 Tax=Robertkochia sediminum TaxID=2785326 RepID=UPI001932D75E|nr:alginate export family protein [Robertkochia sediminum]MBL7472233.1 alginate export family protein [Robertkochia sediminum]
MKPGIGFSLSSGKSKFYGRLSAVASSTLGTDAFAARNTGRVTLEEAHVGYWFDLDNNSSLDVSVGARELKLGTGMFIANGGISGFERGALKFGPRKAWEWSAIGHYKKNDFNARGFWINPNELPSNNTSNELAGIDVNLWKSASTFVGLTYINVLNSEAPYPQAGPGGEGAPVITPGARDGLQAKSFYGKSYPLKSLPNLFTALDWAYEWNSRIDMNAWGGRIQIGYDITGHPWKPMVMVSYHGFSGDDPNTTKQERFDPLYWEGNPNSWTTGSKSSMVFINSNVEAYAFTARAKPTEKDAFTLRYAHVRAMELKSPVQFGQAARVEFSEDGIPTVVTGVNKRSLAEDFFLEYFQEFNSHQKPRKTPVFTGFFFFLPPIDIN